MKPTKLLLASAFITAFILVIIGGVTKVAFGNTNTDTKTVEQYQQREAAYQKLIEEANQRLDQANAELKAVQSQGAPQADTTQAQAPASVKTAVTADQAAQAAQKVVDPALKMLKSPDLVAFEGKPAYEVAFEKGSVYVSAADGSVLFNGTVPQQISADTAAKVAADYLKIKDISKVDKITFRGQELYRVIFSNGMIAYLDLTGQILFVNKPSLVAQADNSSSSGGGGGGGGGGYSEHEGGHDD